MTERINRLRQEVFKANREIVEKHLVISTFGNASGILTPEGLVAIKPSGVGYESLRAEDLVITNLEGSIVEGELRPSTDLETHLELYRSFSTIGGVVHTHSRFATAWAQAEMEIPCLGTTHADYFFGPIPLTDRMTESEIVDNYELNTGKVIARRFTELNPDEFPAVLVASHGPFCWGKSAVDAAHTAVLVEEIARIAYYSRELKSDVGGISAPLLKKHFLRKHGSEAYYGQDEGEH